MRHGHWCDTWNHDMMSKSHADPLRILLEAIFELSQAGFVTETALWKVVEWRPVGTCWNDCTFSQHSDALFRLDRTGFASRHSQSPLTSVYGVHTRPKFKIACNNHRNYMELSQHISRSHFHMSCVQLFLISYPDPYTRAGAWPLDKLELLCCNDQGCGSNVILTLAAHQHPIQLLTGLSWTRLGECFDCFYLFAHIHDNKMTWHCCFHQVSGECMIFDLGNCWRYAVNQI